MHQDPFGEVGGNREIEIQRGQVEVALPRLNVVALEAMLFEELPNSSGRVSGHHRSRDSKKQAELDECSHAMETSRTQKGVLPFKSLCAAKSTPTFYSLSLRRYPRGCCRIGSRPGRAIRAQITRAGGGTG